MRSSRDVRFTPESGHSFGAISKKEAAGDGGFFRSSPTWRVCYLSWVEILVNLASRLVPIALTVAMITTEMPAAIKPYSMAVAPDSSFRNEKTLDIEVFPVVLQAARYLPVLKDILDESHKVGRTSVRIFLDGIWHISPRTL
jgi:hypothetical protein